MNNQKTNQQEWPDDLRKALDEYPRLTASPDFNERVLAALAAKQARQSKIDLFCDQLDRIFERPLLKLLGTAVFAILLAWGGSSLLLQCSGAAMHGANAPTLPFNMETQPLDSLPQHMANLYAWQMGIPRHTSPLPTTKVTFTY